MTPLPPDYDERTEPGEIRDAIRAAVRDRLGEAAGALDTALAKIVEHEYPADMWQLDLEASDIFEVGRELNIVAHFYAEGFQEFTSGLPFEDAVVLTGPPVLTAELLLSWGVDEDDESWDWVFYVAEVEVVGWIAERWRAVCEARFKRRATVACHDADFRFDLHRWEWSDNA